MREAALNLTKSLAQAAQETLLDLEVAVEKENSKTIVPNGNLHPFTIEVMNYVKGLFELIQPFPSCYTFLTNEY
jgi:exocyst complex protein 7